MKIPILIFLTPMIACFLIACDPQNPYETTKGLKPLTDSSANQQRSWAQCNVCHQTLTLSKTHYKHIFGQQQSIDATTGITLNGPVTCMDCHFNSVQHQQFTDSNGVHFVPLFQPGLSVVPEGQSNDTLHYSDTMSLNTLSNFVWAYSDSLAFPSDLGVHHFPAMQALGTNAGGVHNNGQIDLVFAPNVTDSNKIAQGYLAWNSQSLGCEAARCHSPTNNVSLYVW